MLLDLLRGAWNIIAGCFRRQLDVEIERVIEAHEQVHPVISAPILISFNVSPEIHRRLRRNAVPDVGDIVHQHRISGPKGFS